MFFSMMMMQSSRVPLSREGLHKLTKFFRIPQQFFGGLEQVVCGWFQAVVLCQLNCSL